MYKENYFAKSVLFKKYDNVDLKNYALRFRIKTTFYFIKTRKKLLCFKFSNQVHKNSINTVLLYLDKVE